MTSRTKALFCWSGGKDSAYALHQVLLQGTYDVRYLLTTLNGNFKRISMHGVREELLDRQAQSIGIPLIKVVTTESSNSDYERQMERALVKAKSEGIGHVIFGDIFLDDLRLWREAKLARLGLKGVFPLWQRDTGKLVRDFVGRRFRSVLCCTNDEYLGREWAGREIDRAFIKELPEGVDPCGENGEYHSFCYDGPLFKEPVGFKRGEKVFRPLELATDDNGRDVPVTKGFWFCDLMPGG
jgi:uncharacterized protein (TIGR00290 family)